MKNTEIKEVLCNRKKVRIRIDSDADESVFGEIFVDREYKGLESVIGRATASSPILDIGAHVGMFTVYARCFNGAVPILAFEPEKRNFAAMKLNLKENGVGGVMMKNVAVAGVVGMRELFISEDSHNHSLVKEAGGGGAEKIFSTTLERIFLKNSLERASLVKMDCEGAEFEILQSVPAGILAKIQAFYIEYHKFGEGMDPIILKRILEKAGFKVEMRESFYDKRFGFVWATRGK